MSQSNPPALPQVRRIDPDTLLFDSRNPRIQAAAPEGQDAIFDILWRDYAVDEVALSIASNGFFDYEPLLACEEPDGIVVVEGNRRLAAVKAILDPALLLRAKAPPLPDFQPGLLEQLRELPVMLTHRTEVWRFIGFKHVNGPQAWDAMAKAEYVAWVHQTLGEPLEAIATQIGDRHATVARLYNALVTLRQAEDSGLWAREDRWNKRFSFSHLYTGLGYQGIQEYLGIEGAKGRIYEVNPVPKRRQSNLTDVLVWMYGSKERNQPPVVVSQNPDLRNLDETVQHSRGVAALKGGLGLTVSLEIAQGDDQVLRQKLVEAKQALQEATGKVRTGYSGDIDLRELAQDVAILADGIVSDMDNVVEVRDRPRRRR